MAVTSLPGWVGRYRDLSFVDHGRDHRGVDCWGLVYLIYREQLGIELPRYDGTYASTADLEDLARLIGGGMTPWRPIVQRDPATRAIHFGAERIGDVVLMRIGRHPCHVGIVVGDRYMLHIERGIGPALERYDGRAWEHRVVGIYRHREAA